ncbi:hypothetical protein J437_LFUL003203 [Ladona fulva]|uniref:SAM domain-containing protein n=1 Tax=Ladona fulva TaxID=123851 RepID=A0A8K0NTW2_LADFU|nr:hypothetical protein J437_LFUL003203 [Ladona fulva]
MMNGMTEASNGGSTPMEGVNAGEEGGAKSENTSAVSSGVTNGPTSGAPTGMGSRDTHKVPPPKALVKPQVLTHVIEGFVIQEASEPFAVNRSSLLSEMPQPSLKPNNQMMQNHTSQQTDGGRLGSGNVNAQEEGNLTTDNETNDSSGAESSSLSPSEVVQGQEATSARTSGMVGGDPSDDNNSSESGLLSSGCPANATPSTPPQPRINPIKWTVSDVCEFIRNLPGCSDYAEDFAIQEIDGQALLLLKEDHLMTAMSMKLGPALKICARIDTMRGDMKEK